MLRVSDIMTRNVVTIGPDQTLREAIDTLVSCRIGGMPVVAGGKILGVVTAAGILEFESTLAARDDGRDTETEESAESEPLAWDESNEVPAAYFTDLWYGDRHEVVERFANSEMPEMDFLTQHTIAEAMSRSLCVLPEALEVSAAAQRMLAAGVQRAFASDGEDLTGIITTTDILRAVAERRLTVRQRVFSQGSAD